VVKAEEIITMDWDIVSVEPKASLQGEIVALEGTITNQQGQVVLTGSGKILAVDKL
jgi:acyl dehydratase